MIKTPIVLALAALALVGCSKGNEKASVDSALSVGPTTPPLDSLSAAERVGGAAPSASLTTTPAGTAPVVTTPRHVTSTRHTTSGTSRSSGGTYSSGSSATTTTASAPARTTTVKHTKRDAEIGAAAGAIIGATTSHNKIGGAVVGGVVGGVLGGVIGNNVDKTKKH